MVLTQPSDLFYTRLQTINLKSSYEETCLGRGRGYTFRQISSITGLGTFFLFVCIDIAMGYAVHGVETVLGLC